ncbi:6-phosphogluconolactonase [Actinomyces israelii]|uniref:6-phosphogluconolactonase n=1 Tax=Actinomyces israelii TaxID=1659 RepID=UPI0005BAE1E6|nr:6-phosphogluconolactonase [Actinomyces israelii]
MSTAGTIEQRAAGLPAASIVRRPSFDEACALAAGRTAGLLAEAAAARGAGHLALTGGSAGTALARALPAALTAAGIVPSRGLESIHLWFGDERFVPAGHADRNDLLAAGLVEAGVPETNVHRLCGPERAADVEDAAGRLAADLAAAGPAQGRFDVVHLGVGPDAHVCSLFPGHPAARTTGTDVVAVRSSPKPPPERVSLTFDVLHRSRCLMLVAGGKGKAGAARAGLGAPDAAAAPASCARGLVTTWYLDDAAAGALGG